MNLGRTSKIVKTGFCMLEAEEAREYPGKVKLSLEKPGSIFWLPDVLRYKQVGLFTFKKMKTGAGVRRAISRLATLDMKSLLKAQWNAFEARVKVSVTWHRRAKHVIFVGLQDFVSQLLTEDPATQIFIIQLKGKVVVRHCKSLSEECDHVDEEQEEYVTDGAEEQNEEYVSCDEEENHSLIEEEYVTDEARNKTKNTLAVTRKKPSSSPRRRMTRGIKPFLTARKKVTLPPPTRRRMSRVRASPSEKTRFTAFQDPLCGDRFDVVTFRSDGGVGGGVAAGVGGE